MSMIFHSVPGLAGLAMVALATASWAGPARADPLHDAIAADMPALMEVYRDLHAAPELSGREVKTAAKMAKQVRALGFEVTEKVGKTGVVAVMRNGTGPVLMIRADMDGLPVEEKSGLPYASRIRAMTDEGGESYVMHACAHDTHMTAWLGAARRLAAMKHAWSGTLVMILQPAEERGWGAKWMLDDGLFSRFPKPTHAIAFHNSAEALAGVVATTPGFALANVDSVDVIVKGVGGHGAYPHKTKDPIVLGARIVGALQTLVSREMDPQDPAVVTVGSFQAGTKHNVIADEARLLLTVRSYSDETRRHLIEGILRIARGEAIAAGIPGDRMPQVHVKDEYTPATWNVPGFTHRMADLFEARFGKDRVMQAPPAMGGEDFGRYWRADPSIESLIFWVGGVPRTQWDAAQASGAPLPSLHSPHWLPDADAVISTAAEALSASALAILAKQPD